MAGLGPQPLDRGEGLEEPPRRWGVRGRPSEERWGEGLKRHTHPHAIGAIEWDGAQGDRSAVRFVGGAERTEVRALDVAIDDR